MNHLALCAFVVAGSFFVLLCPLDSAIGQKAVYLDKPNDVKGKLPSEEESYLDIQEVIIEKTKSKTIKVTFVLGGEIPRKRNVTSRYYMLMDLDRNVETGKKTTTKPVMGEDYRVWVSVYKDKGEKLWNNHSGNLLKDDPIELKRLKIEDNTISYEMSSRIFKDQPAFHFSPYNWFTEYDEDEEDEVVSRSHFDQIYGSKKKKLQFPSEEKQTGLAEK
ncbi:MAG: hypothetical protein AAF649_09195 [Verrucomicrobiota bacterium]